MNASAYRSFMDIPFQKSDWKPESWADFKEYHFRSVGSEFASKKNGRGVMCESLLENAMACLLECDRQVTRYREQPIGPAWHDGLMERRGTPRDFWVETERGNVLVETKFTKDLADPQVSNDLRQMATYYGRHYGIRLIVRSEVTVFAQPRLENCRILQRYATFELGEIWLDLHDILEGYLSPMPVKDFAEKFEKGRRPDVIAALCRLALDGTVAFDMNKPIDKSALVYWVRQ